MEDVTFNSEQTHGLVCSSASLMLNFRYAYSIFSLRCSHPCTASCGPRSYPGMC